MVSWPFSCLLLQPGAELFSAEEEPLEISEAIETLDGSDTILTALPLDYKVHGNAPAEADFTENGYSDASIQVTAWHEWVGNAYVSAARIRIADASQLRTALANDSMKRANYVWVTGAKNNAVVAVGGEFLGHNEKTYTVRMGTTLRKKGYASRDTLITDANGDFHIFVGYSNEQRQQLEDSGVQIVNLFNFGPALVIDGALKYHEGDTIKYSIGYATSREPRTAIGQIGPLEYLVVVVDGRKVKCPTEDGGTKEAKGMNIIELGQYMLDQGCTQAYTLDGGGSAAMYFHGTTYSHPSAKRGVTDIVYFATLLG